MDSEKKYSVIGRVEIGTDEYRELIERGLSAEKSADEYRIKFWAEQSDKKNAEKALEECKKRLSDVQQFLLDENLMDKYKLWKISKQQEEEE